VGRGSLFFRLVFPFWVPEAFGEVQFWPCSPPCNIVTGGEHGQTNLILASWQDFRAVCWGKGLFLFSLHSAPRVGLGIWLRCFPSSYLVALVFCVQSAWHSRHSRSVTGSQLAGRQAIVDPVGNIFPR